jgi:hypothetical protein
LDLSKIYLGVLHNLDKTGDGMGPDPAITFVVDGPHSKPAYNKSLFKKKAADDQRLLWSTSKKFGLEASSD